MKFKLTIKVIVLFLFVTLIHYNGWAQVPGREAAKISKIADLSKKKPKIIKDKESTTLVQIKRQNGPWLATEPKKLLFFEDLLHLKKSARVKLAVAQPFQKINLVFLTASVAGSSVILTDEGTYGIREEPEGSKNVAIDIQEGSSIIEVLKGKLRVYAGRLLSIMSSSSTTRALFVMNPDSSGLVYLEKGKAGAIVFPDSLSFPDSVKGHLRPGQVARFRNNRVLEIKHISLLVFASATLPRAAQLKSVITYNKTIWASPWWQSPAFLIPAAAAVGVIAIAITVGDENGPPTLARLPDPPGPPGN